MRLRMLVWIGALAAGAATAWAAEPQPLLAQQPTLGKTSVVFVYGGYLWSVPRDGGEARQLTTGGHESRPFFSPDGAWIAFSGQYDGNRDVYVMPAEGGAPRRLTWHPGPDYTVGWTPDGKRVLFLTQRDAFDFFSRLYTVPAEGGWPEPLPMWRAREGSYSPDGTHLAYVPNLQWQRAWKRYRGGQTTPIDVVRLSDLAQEKVPRQGSNDFNPVWVGDTIYFLSDRDGPVTLYAYDTKAKSVRRVLASSGLDLKSFSAGPGGLVYEQLGGLYLLDPNGGQPRHLDVRIAGDLPATRPHYEKVGDQVVDAALSPTGKRALFEARGEILSVPAEKGDIRDLTRTPAVAERSPAWSPDGKWIAYFSDESGEYALHLADQSGLGEVRKIGLGDPPSFFYGPLWSPDSKKIAYTDKRLNLWLVDVDKGTPIKVDANPYDDPSFQFALSWSPDSQWLAYDRLLASHLAAVFVYPAAGGASHQVTDGLGDARFPAFDRKGKLLYFAASTDLGLTLGWLDLSSFQHPVSRGVYALVLKKGEASPVKPESDEEKVESAAKKDDDGSAKKGAKAEDKDKDRDKDKGKDKDKESAKKGDEKDEAKEEKPPAVDIDFAGITQRAVLLPIDPANYVGLAAGKAGVLFLTQIPTVPSLASPTPLSVTRFDLEKRKTEPFLSGIGAFIVSANGEKALYRQGPAGGPGGSWAIAGTDSAPKSGDGALSLDGMEVRVDPRAEWAQMYHEVWRIERDFFYDPHFHGLDLAAAEAKYKPYLAGVGGRDDLNHLFEEMLGELTVGHMFISGGDTPKAPEVAGGLLGADYEIADGRYRFTHVYDGESWNPDLQAPLAQPGAEVAAGEYLLEVEGREVRPPESVYRFFENTAGKQVHLKVGPNPDGKGSRELTVVPIADESSLRSRAWEEGNRRKVDELSGGKLAYVHVPDTTVGGFVSFNRYYFAQVGKQGAVIDERYNSGGQIADYIIDLLERPLRNCAVAREGAEFCSPLAQIYGPKTMVINEMSGSGGDALPWMFRQDKIGPLVGTRTWGGLVGIYNYPRLLDGGRVTAPRVAIYGLHGQWEVENHGVAPDVEVENDPASVAAGHDPQLEKAVEVTLKALAEHPVVIPDHPPYPVYHRE